MKQLISSFFLIRTLKSTSFHPQKIACNSRKLALDALKYWFLSEWLILFALAPRENLALFVRTNLAFHRWKALSAVRARSGRNKNCFVTKRSPTNVMLREGRQFFIVRIFAMQVNAPSENALLHVKILVDRISRRLPFCR